MDGIFQVAFLCKSKGEPHKSAKIRKDKSPEGVWQMPFTKSLFTDIFVLVYCLEFGYIAYFKGRFAIVTLKLPFRVPWGSVWLKPTSDILIKMSGYGIKQVVLQIHGRS